MAKNKVKQTGIMNKLRDRMPLIIIILIIAFLATIIFEWGMDYLGGGASRSQVFAEINGEEVSYQEFESMVQQQVEQMRTQNPETEIDETMMQQIREQVWNQVLTQTIVRQKINEFGVVVYDNEILDWIYNRPNTLPEEITRIFQDSLGVFSIEAYQNALATKSPEANQFWQQVEAFLKQTLQSEKLQNIVTQGAIVTEGDVLQKYKDENIIADINYAFLDVNSITDTNLFTVNDEDLRRYYDSHKFEFRQEESVKLRYVTIPVTSTIEDSNAVRNQLGQLIQDLKTIQMEDSALIKFVNMNSTSKFTDEFQKPNAFSPEVNEFLFTAQPGDVSEVLTGNDGLKIVRLMESKDGEETFVNATHILINFGEDTSAANKKANDILARIRNGEDIEKLAMELSDDPSAKQNSGNLGWFTKGAMVAEFENAAMNASVGSVVGPVKTQYGFHIIKINGKANKEFKIAEINMTITPGGRTRELARKKAEDFYNLVEKGENFDSAAKKMDLTVQLSPEINKEGTIPGITQNRNLMNYVFDKKVGTIHEPVRVTGGFGVYEITDKIPEGYKNFDSVKVTLVKPKVVQQKKFEALKQRADELKNKIQNGNLMALRETVPQYIYDVADSISVAKPAPAIGQDHVVNHEIFSVLQPGQISVPVKGTRGYYIIQLNSRTEFNEADYLSKAESIRQELLTQKKQAIVQEWLTQLQKEADIVDNRENFYG